MNTHLRLVVENPTPKAHARLDGHMLLQLADRMTAEIRTGHADVARDLASFHRLSPFGIAVVAHRMTRAGVSEDEILEAVVW